MCRADGSSDRWRIRYRTDHGAALAARRASAACLDLKPDDVPAPPAGIPADVADVAVRVAVEKAARRGGGIDILVDTAGIGARGSVEGNTDDERGRVFEVNVFGIVRVSQAALPHLRRSRSAAIVNTWSIPATAGLPERALYSSTQGVFLSLIRATAADPEHSGIRGNCANPGTADHRGSAVSWTAPTARPARSHGRPPADGPICHHRRRRRRHRVPCEPALRFHHGY